MDIARAVHVQNDAVSRLRDCYSAAKSYALTHEQVRERKQRDVYARIPKGTPRWVRAYVHGYDHALLDRTMQTDLIFGVWDGIAFYNHERGNPDSVDARGMSYSDFAAMLHERNLTQSFYWKHRPERPF
jgi:hypothetical protein